MPGREGSVARSRKKTPIAPITSAESEKADKLAAHRRERRKIRQRMMVDADADALPHTREVSNPWTYAKDGKVYRGARLRPEERRK
jgi:hypothetical protein